MTLVFARSLLIKNHMDKRHETIKLLEENIGCKLLDIDFGDDVLNLTLKAERTRIKLKIGSTSC